MAPTYSVQDKTDHAPVNSLRYSCFHKTWEDHHSGHAGMD